MKISLDPKEFNEILLSHHPDLPCFKDDVVVIFGRRICAGCLFAYPAAILFWFFFRPEGFESIIIAIALAIISEARRFCENRYLNFFFRFIAGIALGFGLGGFLWAIRYHDMTGIIIVIAGGCVYAMIKYFSMQKKLSDCKREMSRF